MIGEGIPKVEECLRSLWHCKASGWEERPSFEVVKGIVFLGCRESAPRDLGQDLERQVECHETSQTEGYQLLVEGTHRRGLPYKPFATA